MATVIGTVAFVWVRALSYVDYPSLSRTFGSWGTVQVGPTYQRVKMEDPGEEKPPEGAAGLTPEQLREYLRRMNPEDFGRFNP